MDQYLSKEIEDVGRLYLRPIALKDAPRIAELAGHPEVASWTSNIPHPYQLGDAKSWIKKTHADPLRQPFAIITEGKLLGCVSYWENNDGNMEIGYWIGRPYWGAGIASQALKKLLKSEPELSASPLVIARVMKGNMASQRVLIKNGFRSEKPCSITKAGKEIDGLVFHLRK